MANTIRALQEVFSVLDVHVWHFTTLSQLLNIIQNRTCILLSWTCDVFLDVKLSTKGIDMTSLVRQRVEALISLTSQAQEKRTGLP